MKSEIRIYLSQISRFSILLHLRQHFNRCREFEIFWEQFVGMWIHQFVRLANGHISYASYVTDFLLTTFLLRRLERLTLVNEKLVLK